MPRIENGIKSKNTKNKTLKEKVNSICWQKLSKFAEQVDFKYLKAANWNKTFPFSETKNSGKIEESFSPRPLLHICTSKISSKRKDGWKRSSNRKKRYLISFDHKSLREERHSLKRNNPELRKKISSPRKLKKK